jgi:hypothetical protein
MGQIADWTRDGKKQLTDIVGIGPKSAEKISDACIAWFAANRPPAKDEPAKDEPPAEGDQNAA